MHNTCDECSVIYCLAERMDNGKNCPCVNCLIKVMCSVSCKEFCDYYGEMVKSLKEEGIHIE